MSSNFGCTGAVHWLNMASDGVYQSKFINLMLNKEQGTIYVYTLHTCTLFFSVHSISIMLLPVVSVFGS